MDRFADKKYSVVGLVVGLVVGPVVGLVGDPLVFLYFCIFVFLVAQSQTPYQKGHRPPGFEDDHMHSAHVN